MIRLLHALLGACAAIGLSAECAVAAEPRCAFIDVDTETHSAPKEQCFGMHLRCADRLGCFKGQLQFKPGFVNRPGEPEMRETAALFGYIDPLDVHWDVPTGFATDGASIPPAFKPFLGGSWHKNYIRAAVLHDFYIRRITANPEHVHRLFFNALLASGTPPDLARVMYAAVKKYGPQWTTVDMGEYMRRRQQNLAMIDRQNEAFRRQYEECLQRNFGRLRAAATAEWFRCALHEDQLVPDLVQVIEGAAQFIFDDFAKGKCVEVAKDKYECPALDLTGKQ
jgi:hypothetical protein